MTGWEAFKAWCLVAVVMAAGVALAVVLLAVGNR